jgi:hypothetical protein
MERTREKREAPTCSTGQALVHHTQVVVAQKIMASPAGAALLAVATTQMEDALIAVQSSQTAALAAMDSLLAGASTERE